MPAIPHMTKIAKSVSPFAISFFKGIDRLSEQDGGFWNNGLALLPNATHWLYYSSHIAGE